MRLEEKIEKYLGEAKNQINLLLGQVKEIITLLKLMGFPMISLNYLLADNQIIEDN